MRTPKRVKQLMYHAVYHLGETLYERDAEGNIIYDTMPDGETIPRIVGETPPGYYEPTDFYNSITGELTEEELQAFGTETSEKAKMTYNRNEFTFNVGDLIWKDSEIKHLENGNVDKDSADYRVVGIQSTGRHFYKALLVAVV